MARRRGRPRRFSRARARVSRAKRRVHHKIKKHGKSIWAQVTNAAGVLVFVSQITSKDRQNYSNLPMQEKAKELVNNISGRILGFNPFSGRTQYPQTLEIGNGINRTFGVGVGTWLYSFLPKVPHKSKARRLGKVIAISSFLGGIFDAPEFDTRNQVLAQRASSTAQAGRGSIVVSTVR